MSAIPATSARVPNLMRSMIFERNIVGTNVSLLRTQEQLATLLRINRPSDDPIAAALVGVLDQRIEAGGQYARNLGHASSVLDTIDQSLGQLTEGVLEAKEIASSQVGIGSDPGTRRNQAIVINSLIEQMFTTVNRSFAGMHLFGGERTGAAPFVSYHGGYRYIGSGDGLQTDLGGAVDFPITVGGDFAVGALSARVEGDVDLNPQLVDSTRLQDLRGPALGRIPLGLVEVTIDPGGPVQTIQIDLSGAATIGDVARTIESAILEADPASLGGAFPTNIGFAGDRLSIGNISAGYTITFADGPSGSSATALGLGSFAYDAANALSTNPNAGLDPQITDRTTLGSLNPADPIDFGTIVFRNGGRAGSVTIDPGMTVGELKEAVRRLDLGVRLEVSPNGNSFNVFNEVSGFRMAVEESGGLSATTLGIRTLKPSTSLSSFNDGRGVEIAHGAVDPVTGLPDPQRNLDFEITLTDGSSFTVDLTPDDAGSVSTVLAKINADAAAAGFGAVFSASLGTGGNGIVFQDTSGGVGELTIRSLHGRAAEDLGLLDGTFTGGAPATFAGSDRATVRVDSIFSTLIDLRTALETDDEPGITFAGARLEDDIERLAQARALIGGRAARVESAKTRLEDVMLLDESIRSDLRDLDFIEASSRFSLLQTQLQAGMIAASSLQNISLLNFLG